MPERVSMTTKVYVTRRIPKAGLSMLRSAFDAVRVHDSDEPPARAELLAAVRGCVGLLAMLTERVDAELLDAAGPQLRVVANYAVGHDNVDLAECTRRGVLLTNTPDVLTDATADLAWTLLMAAARRVVEADRLVRSGGWSGWAPLQMLGVSVASRTLGIVGAGRIGSAVARRSAGFDMRVLYCDARANPDLERELGARRVALGALLEKSDFVSLHVPLTEGTRGLIGGRELGRMKPGAILVNTSRGPVVDEEALAEALRERRIGAAGLDVYTDEPRLAPGLAMLDNAVLAPHMGSATHEARQRMAELAAENLIVGARGGEPPNCVNLEAHG